MLIILCGLDRTGKSTVAELYKKQGFEVIHMSAPDKRYREMGIDGQMEYFIDMIRLYISIKGKNVVFDRSAWGELIWPKVYKRPPMLTMQMLKTLHEIEDILGVERILMYDPNVEAHWQRCVDNNEPLTREQFDLANKEYKKLEIVFGFKPKTLNDFIGVK